MKKVFINLFQWVASLFRKTRKVTLTSITDKTIEVETEIEWGSLPDNPIYEIPVEYQNRPTEEKKEKTPFNYAERWENVEIDADAEISEPIIQENVEVVPKTTSRKLTKVKIWSVGLNGKVYQLTNKQFVFYTLISQHNRSEIGGAKTKDFIKAFYLEMGEEIPKETDEKLRLGYHNKTMKYLLKSGLVTKVNNNIYKANR